MCQIYASVLEFSHFIVIGLDFLWICYTFAIKMDSMSENTNTVIADSIKNLIYTVRGLKVMLDADLAAIYGYTTKAFNQQVKNNIEKFDDDFRFQLTKDEYYEILRSKNLTLSCYVNDSISNNNENKSILRSKFLTLELEQGKYSKYLPYVFTEQGVYMLMTVLKGELATQQSKALVRAFKEMKDYIVDNRSLVGKRELLQLSMQTTQNTKDIAEIKKEMVTKADLAKVIQDFTDPQTRREYLILNGEVMDYNTDKEKIYHCGASSKDAGNKVTTITRVSDCQIYHQIVDTLLQNPVLSLR